MILQKDKCITSFALLLLPGQLRLYISCEKPSGNDLHMIQSLISSLSLSLSLSARRLQNYKRHKEFITEPQQTISPTRTRMKKNPTHLRKESTSATVTGRLIYILQDKSSPIFSFYYNDLQKAKHGVLTSVY